MRSANAPLAGLLALLLAPVGAAYGIASPLALADVVEGALVDAPRVERAAGLGAPAPSDAAPRAIATGGGAAPPHAAASSLLASLDTAPALDLYDLNAPFEDDWGGALDAAFLYYAAADDPRPQLASGAATVAFPRAPSAPRVPSQPVLAPAANEPEGAPEAAPSGGSAPAPAEGEAASAAPPPAWAKTAAFAAGVTLLLVAPFALYHRLRGARALDSARRARLMALVCARPGITRIEAARELAVDPTTAGYHLARLAREGLVVAQGKAGSRVRYFAPGSVAAHERALFGVADEARAILDALRAAPGESQSAVARRLGIGRSTLRWHVAKLRAAGLVR